MNQVITKKAILQDLLFDAQEDLACLENEYRQRPNQHTAAKLILVRFHIKRLNFDIGEIK
jgi:hypothetical protein